MPVAINGALSAQAKDVFNGLKRSRYREVSEQRLFGIKGSRESLKGYFLGSGMHAFIVVGIDLTVEYLLDLFYVSEVVSCTGSHQVILQPPIGALYFAFGMR